MTVLNFDLARHNMLLQQVRPWLVINEHVLNAMEQIPRENFVPDAYRNVSYADIEIPLPHNEHMLFPRIEGRMLEAVEINSNERALLIGAGSGYLAALMGKLASSVTAIEINPDLASLAKENIDKLSLSNISIKEADASQPIEDNRGFDVIILSGSIPEFTQHFLDSLRVGGRLFAVIGTSDAMTATLVTRISAADWQQRELFDTVLSPLHNFTSTPPFTF